MPQTTFSSKYMQELADTKRYTVEQLEEIRTAFERAFAAGYDYGRLYNPRAKIVIEFDEYGKILNEFDSTQAVVRAYPEIAHQLVSAVCLGKQATTHGKRFRFKNVEDYYLKHEL